MDELARVMIIIGVVLIVAGLVMLGVHKPPFPGKLPGDIIIKRDNYTLYFPLATGIIISIIISLVLYLINKFR